MSRHNNAGKINILHSREFARQVREIAVYHGETMGQVIERLSKDAVLRERRRIAKRVATELGEAGA